jgi:integrase
VKKGLLPFNPADAASPPTALATRSTGSMAPETRIWTPEQLSTFFDQIEGHHLAALVRVAAMTGMRRGELCGLRWIDVDLDRETLNVRKTVVAVQGTPKVGEPKSEKSRRTIDLDAGTVAALHRHKVEQKELQLLCGPGWQDSGLVFTNPSGGAWHPDTITGTVQRLIDGSGLPRITLHGLRHTHVTHYLKATHDVREASGRAGHASTSFTLDRYGHVLPGGQAAGAAAVAALVDGSEERSIVVR